MSFQDPATMMDLDPKEEFTPISRENENRNGGGISHSESGLPSDIEAIGNKIKHHKANLNFLRSLKTKLEASIIDLQVQISKLHSSVTPKIENNDTNLQGEDINAYENSAAGVLGLIQSRHGAQVSQLMSTKGVVGIVAKLGKVNDNNLNRVLSEYLGTYSMLALVCENYENVKALETYDRRGNIDRDGGLHGLASSIGKTVEGQFHAICLENLRPYAGRYIDNDDPQRKLDLLKPKLANGEFPRGFLGFAVNFIQIDPVYLLNVTTSGYGLRETLFYTLFSHLQVYKTRDDMINAAPCISHGAVSLDGGIINKTGIFMLGSRDEVKVRFAKPSGSRAMEDYSNKEKQLKELKWKKEKTVEDIKREKVLLDQANFSFGIKKEEFIKSRVSNQ